MSLVSCGARGRAPLFANSVELRMKKIWLGFVAVLLASFAVLGWAGVRVYQEAPPIPSRVLTIEGSVVVAERAVLRGQNVWQSIGGMEVGSIWGHGSYVAPDWTADWLHREATFILARWSKSDFGIEYAQLDGEKQAQLQGRLAKVMRTNTYDPATKSVN